MDASRRKFIRQSTLLSVISTTPTHLLKQSPRLLANNSVFLFQGDSITDGNRCRNTDLNHILGHGYAYAVSSRIGADFPASRFQFINKGISGNTVPDLLKRWNEDTLALKPQVLSLLIGINDVNAEIYKNEGYQGIEDFKKGYRLLLEQTKQQNPEIIFVLGLVFVSKGTRTKDHFDDFVMGVNERNHFIKEISQEYDALLVDYPALFEKAFQKQSDEYWIWDGVHPTVFGHELMAREWIKVVSHKLPFLKKYQSKDSF